MYDSRSVRSGGDGRSGRVARRELGGDADQLVAHGPVLDQLHLRSPPRELSGEHGRVTLAWTAVDSRFRLRWEERGGPAVKQPNRTGFGSRMIERGLSAELQGEVRLAYEPQGVVCTIDAPLEAIEDREAS